MPAANILADVLQVEIARSLFRFTDKAFPQVELALGVGFGRIHDAVILSAFAVVDPPRPKPDVFEFGSGPDLLFHPVVKRAKVRDCGKYRHG